MRGPLCPGFAARVVLGLAALVALAGTVRSAPPEATREQTDRHGFLARMLLSSDRGERAWGAVAARHVPVEQAAPLQQVLATEVLCSTGALRAPQEGSGAPEAGLVHLDVRLFRSSDLEWELRDPDLHVGSLRVESEPASGWQTGAPGRIAPLDDFRSATRVRASEKGVFEMRLRALSIRPPAQAPVAAEPRLQPTHDHVLDLRVGALDPPTFVLPERGALLAQTWSIADGSPSAGDWLVYVCAERGVPEEEPAPR